MSGFTKLVPEIVDSSIWSESSDVRIVWITMLATKDKDGYVRGDARAISRKAIVPLDVVEKALELFQTPDPNSYTPDNDGRRIAKLPGGWLVLNHEKYRIRDHNEEHAEYVREWRKKRTKTSTSSKCESHVNHTSASVSASASESESDSEAIAIFEAYPRRVYRPRALKAIKTALQTVAFNDLLEATKAYSLAVRGKDQRFIPHPDKWFEQEGWRDKDCWEPKTAEQIQEIDRYKPLTREYVESLRTSGKMQEFADARGRYEAESGDYIP
jgi:hypothetical protein